MQHDNITKKQAAFAAVGSITVPDFIQLNEREHIFFEIVTKSKAAALWTDLDTIHATNLARLFVQIELLQARVEIEGEIIETENTQKISPATKILNEKIALSVSYSRFLCIHPTATCGEAKQQRKTNALHRTAANTASEIFENDDDDLLAK